MKEQYVIRAFFDVSALSCLWSGNDDAEAEWGYNIVLEHFPVSDDLKALIGSAQNDFEEIINHRAWKAKSGKKKECAQLNAKCRDIIALLRDELGGEFEIVDDLKVECSNPLPVVPENFWLWFVLFFSIVGGLIILLYGFRAGIGGPVVRDINMRIIVGSYVILPGVFILIIYLARRRDVRSKRNR